MALKSEPIQLFTPFFRTDEVLSEIRECLDRGWTGLGFKTVEFEEAWKNSQDVPHAHFLNSATAALHVALEVLRRRKGWEPGDEVISTPLTFVSTNHSIMHAGLTPVFADIDDSLNLDPRTIEGVRSSRTRAVMYVGLGGNPGQLREVADYCRSEGLSLILDAAHMAGTRIDGKNVAQFADVTCYSFQAVKNLPTADSGMICFRDGEDDKAARELSWLGINKDTYSRARSGTYSWDYDVPELGYKYHGNSVIAAMGIVGLKYLESDNERRREIAHLYENGLQGACVRTIPIPAGVESSRHLFQVRTRDRERLLAHLNEQNIFPGVHYKDNTEYPMYAHMRGSCPRAAAASRELLSLPLHLRLSDSDVARVVFAIREFGS